MLTDEQLRGLIAKWRRTGDNRYRDQIVADLHDAIESIAYKENRKFELEDLISEGYVGLMKAVDRFDLSRSEKFVTYAWPYIRGEMKHYLRDTRYFVRIPAYIQERQTPLPQLVVGAMHPLSLSEPIPRPPSTKIPIGEIAILSGLTGPDCLLLYAKAVWGLTYDEIMPMMQGMTRNAVETRYRALIQDLRTQDWA